jgi:hypothetical protein
MICRQAVSTYQTKGYHKPDDKQAVSTYQTKGYHKPDDMQAGSFHVSDKRISQTR